VVLSEVGRMDQQSLSWELKEEMVRKPVLAQTVLG